MRNKPKSYKKGWKTRRKNELERQKPDPIADKFLRILFGEYMQR